MKVILLRDVAKIGKKFSVVEVPDGFALNKLIPQKDAEPANLANLKRILEKKKNNDYSKEGELAVVLDIHKACVDEPLVIIMEANEQGHLFQSVRRTDILTAAKLRGLLIPESFLQIKEPVKSVGKHEVIIEAHGIAKPLAIIVVAKSK